MELTWVKSNSPAEGGWENHKPHGPDVSHFNSWPRTSRGNSSCSSLTALQKPLEGSFAPALLPQTFYPLPLLTYSGPWANKPPLSPTSSVSTLLDLLQEQIKIPSPLPAEKDKQKHPCLKLTSPISVCPIYCLYFSLIPPHLPSIFIQPGFCTWLW